MRYPIGIQTFEKIIEGKYVYVDKTEYIFQLAQENVCFLSRPRRFGKSLLVSTLEAYFKGKRELFQGLKIEQHEKDWKRHPVFRIDYAGGNFTEPEELTKKLEAYLYEWESQYGKKEYCKTLSDRFESVLKLAKEKTGYPAVVLIDEYDKPILDVLGTEQEEINRNILRGFYGTFKSADEHLRFVFLTGVTKVSQISIFSGFNQPNDISMDSKYDALCGITEEELYSYFDEPIKELADELDYTAQEMKSLLKKQYDGYHFSKKMQDIYNPFSIITAFEKKVVADYWYQTGTPAYLVKILKGNQNTETLVNMQELTSQKYEPQYFIDYRAEQGDPLALLYQSGYLTIKGYDKRYNEYELDYPNNEVKKGFMTLLGNGYFGSSNMDSNNWMKNMDRMLRQADLEGIRDAFTSFFASIPYEANKNERALDFESHYQYTFYIINRLLSCYVVLIEKQNSKGRADTIIECENDIYIFEFKLDGSAKDALKQIEEKQYDLPYLTDRRKIHKIGVNISSESRTIDEWMVE